MTLPEQVWGKCSTTETRKTGAPFFPFFLCRNICDNMFAIAVNEKQSHGRAIHSFIMSSVRLTHLAYSVDTILCLHQVSRRPRHLSKNDGACRRQCQTNSSGMYPKLEYNYINSQSLATETQDLTSLLQALRHANT